MTGSRTQGRMIVLLAALCTMGLTSLRASDATWSSTAGSGAWETDANWVGGTAPGATGTTTNPDTATFSTASTALNVILDATRNIKNITFSTASVGAYVLGTVGGNALRLSDGGTIQTASAVNNNEVVNAPLEIQGNGGTYTFTSGASNNARLLTLGGGITGTATSPNVTTLTLQGSNTGANTLSGIVGDGIGGGKLGLAKTGDGAWILTGANAFSGGTTLESGTLHLNNASAIGTGTLTLNGGTLVNSRGGSTTLSTNNAQAWDGDFTFTGKAAQTDPKVSWNLNLGTGAVSLGANRTVTVSGYTSQTGWSWETAALTVGGGIADSGNGYALTKAGIGQLSLSGANSYSGGTVLNAGTLTIGNALALGTGTFTVNGGTIRNNTPITLTANNPHVWNGNFSVSYPMSNELNLGTGGVTLANSITLTLGANSWGSLWNVPSVIAESGGSRSLTVASGGSNPGALNLAAANSFTGGTILNGGVIRISNTQALGTGTFTVAALGGGISQNTGGSPLIGITNQVWSGNISMSATAGAINLGTSPVTVTPGSCTITLDNGSATVGGNISGAGASLTFRGTGYQGNFIFTGTNTFDGGLTLQPGTANTLTLNMYNASTIGTGPLTINQGSGQAVRFDNSSGVPVTLTYNNPQKWNNSSFSFVGTTNLNMGTGAVTLGTNVTLSANANTLTLGGAIGQVDATPRSLRKIGAGTLAIAGAGTYAGGTVVTNGTLSVEVGGVLGVGAVTVSPPGKIVLKHGEAIADDAAVTLTRIGTSYGKMDLIADVVERVGSVVLDGVTYSEPGTSFGAVGTGSTVESNNFFLGTGQLKITTSGTTTILIR